MRLLHLGLALAFLLGAAILADAAPAKKGQKGKKGAHALHGTVIAVTKDKEKDSGTITVQVRAGKKKNQANAAAAVDKTFQVTNATRFQVVRHVKGQKGQTEQSPTTFAHVHKGEHVIVLAKGSVAEDVKIVQGSNKKKNKK